jgi:hypothetical protein
VWTELGRLLIPATIVAGTLVFVFWLKDPDRKNSTYTHSPVLTRLLLIAFAVYFAAWLGLVALGGGGHPTEFDANTGHTYEWISHGVIYLTRNEKFAADFLEWMLWLALGLCAMCGGIIGSRQRRLDEQKYVRH